MGFFGNLIKTLGRGVEKHANNSRPSMITNVMQGKKFNHGLPLFGGDAPLQDKLKYTPQAEAKPQAGFFQQLLGAMKRKPASPLPQVASPIPQRDIIRRRPQMMVKSAQATATPPPPLPTPTMHPQADELERRTFPTFQKMGVHPAVAYGIAQAEGGRIGKNNIWNLNAVDSNPNLAYNYDSPEAAATDAAKLILKMMGVNGPISNPSEAIEVIQNAGYAGDPKTWKQRSIDTGGAGINFDSWADFVRATQKYKKWGGK